MTSSLNFLGNSTSNIVIPYSSDLDFGTGDFTIEWYQYETDTNSFPRPFSRGNYPTATIGVSIEGGSSFYLWLLGDFEDTISTPLSPPTWYHFAIVRSSGVTSVYKNGTIQFSFSDTNDYTSIAENLTIGNETTVSDDAAFGGYMYYFAWNKGYARYTSNFTVTNEYPPFTSSTVGIMVNANGSYGTLGSSITYPYNNITTVSEIPAPATPPAPVNTFYSSLLWGLYSDNSRVFYKPNSLSWSIGSTVRNSRAVSKRT